MVDFFKVFFVELLYSYITESVVTVDDDGVNEA